jgi:hypothetical protein
MALARPVDVDAGRSADPRPVVSLIKGTDITPQPIDWLWDDHLAKGKVHIIAGKPSTGKTTICLDWAQQCPAVQRFPTAPGPPLERF